MCEARCGSLIPAYPKPVIINKADNQVRNIEMEVERLTEEFSQPMLFIAQQTEQNQLQGGENKYPRIHKYCSLLDTTQLNVKGALSGTPVVNDATNLPLPRFHDRIVKRTFLHCLVKIGSKSIVTMFL